MALASVWTSVGLSHTTFPFPLLTRTWLKALNLSFSPGLSTIHCHLFVWPDILDLTWFLCEFNLLCHQVMAVWRYRSLILDSVNTWCSLPFTAILDLCVGGGRGRKTAEELVWWPYSGPCEWQTCMLATEKNILKDWIMWQLQVEPEYQIPTSLVLMASSSCYGRFNSWNIEFSANVIEWLWQEEVDCCNYWALPEMGEASWKEIALSNGT